MALIFVGFTIFSMHQQKKYAETVAETSVQTIDGGTEIEIKTVDGTEVAAGTENTENEAIDNTESVTAETADADAEQADAVAVDQDVVNYGETLAQSRKGEEETFTVENEYLKLTFSNHGGQIVGAELKEYTRYAPKNERNESVQLFDPSTANFNMLFSVRNGTRDVPVNTSEYYFEVLPIEKSESEQRVTMVLPVAEDARFVYEYTIYNTAERSRDYMVNLTVRLESMANVMSRDNRALQIEWSNTSYQNERGFKNENMYTTVAYRRPGSSSISELSMSDNSKSDEAGTSINWVAFKQQFFSSVFIAHNNFNYAKFGYTTAEPDSDELPVDSLARAKRYVKNFAARLSVPYDSQAEQYDFSFYLGPNKYAILKNITDENGDQIALERLVPLGWGIFGWVNRWFTIPVFDFLRRFIGSFGLIILILAILVKIIIFPLTYKSYLSTAKMRVIKPEIDALSAKYPKQEDAMKKQQAMMELYKKAGINPMGGCIPMLIQMPIIIAMFRFFPASIELRGQAFLWSGDLSSYDSILNLPFNIPFYGGHISLFALLMALVFFIYSYVNYKQTASSQPQMIGMKFMMVYMMPVMMLMWFNSYASGLSYYYFLTTLITMVQTWLIRRMVDDEKIHAMMKANAAKKSNGKKSKFQQRYEAFMRQQQQQTKRK